MTKEKWLDILGNISDKFEIEEKNKIHYDEDGGVDVEYVIFNGPLGRMKLEFIVRPVILDKKTKYSNRIGSQTAVEYVYSEHEKTYKLKAYKWDNSTNDWLEMEAKNFEL